MLKPSHTLFNTIAIHGKERDAHYFDEDLEAHRLMWQAINGQISDFCYCVANQYLSNSKNHIILLYSSVIIFKV